jgi:hypothetical protein
MTMQRAFLLGLVLAVAPSIAGAQRVSVQQLEQILASSGPTPDANADDIGKMDLQDQINREESLAPRLASLELTEHLSSMTRARLLTKYKLGPLTRSALELLADRSSLLEPPASEALNLPPPDADAQRTMVRQAGAFVFQTLTHLPDFFALLTTTQFDDGPVIISGETLAADPGMHRVGSSQREITFSEGREVFDSSRVGLASKRGRVEGLDSQGEFGAEAAIVFLDVAHGTLTFHHWEQSTLGPVAVFHYAVPQASSHYEVKYACEGKQKFHAQPPYHGSLSIDPAAGVLVRFTIQAQSEPDDPISQVGSAVEYGPVVLGERKYFCPVRSLAFSQQKADTCVDAHKRRLTRPVDMLNRIVFSDYHRLGSEMVIVPGQQNPAEPGHDGDTPKPSAPPQTSPDQRSVPHSR